MSFLRRLIPGLDDDSDEEGEGEALLEHEDYSSSESESSGSRDDTLQLEIGGEYLIWVGHLLHRYIRVTPPSLPPSTHTMQNSRDLRCMLLRILSCCADIQC